MIKSIKYNFESSIKVCHKGNQPNRFLKNKFKQVEFFSFSMALDKKYIQKKIYVIKNPHKKIEYLEKSILKKEELLLW